MRLANKGVLTAKMSMTDIDTGSYTVLSQIAGEMLGLPVSKVSMQLGDSDFLETAGLGGSFGAASSGSALFDACMNLRAKLARAAGIAKAQAVFAAGRILNMKTATSQALGGIIWGVGSALHEEAIIDPRFGFFVNHNLAEYHVPVHADILAIEAIFLPEVDDKTNPLDQGRGRAGYLRRRRSAGQCGVQRLRRAHSRLPADARQGTGCASGRCLRLSC